MWPRPAHKPGLFKISSRNRKKGGIFVHADQEKLTYRKSNKTVLVKVVKGNEKLNQNGANTVRKTFHLSWSAKLMLKFTVHDKTIPCCNIKVFNPHAKKFQYISRFLQAMPNNISRIQSYLVNDKWGVLHLVQLALLVSPIWWMQEVGGSVAKNWEGCHRCPILLHLCQDLQLGYVAWGHSNYVHRHLLHVPGW